ncbi:MAG: hypothetical protein H7222_12630 [Methylotenera sp.]|nr:hypothetical protein [Oligoflexia bacterium]
MVKFLLPAIVASVFVLTGCGSSASSADAGEISSSVQTSRPQVSHTAFKTDILIFQGSATAYGDAESLQTIADAHGLSSVIRNSSQMDQMTVEELATFGAIVWPGGYAGQMSDSLKASTRRNIQAAVKERGVGFVGFCAGAFIAISPDTKWGFSLIAQPTLPYYHLEDEGTDTAMVSVNLSDGTKRNLVWWGGPTLPEFPGGVIARYGDTGQPAIAQAWAGNGLMILSAPHPEAPESWRGKLGLSDSDGLDHDIAFNMIQSAIQQQPMKSF